MAAGACAGEAEALWIHTPPRGVVPDEAHGPMDVGHDLADDKLRL